MDIYKQKYEEALSQAEKELKCCGSLDCDAARQIFRLFPELKESEDDIMRKMAIHAVYSPEAQSCIKSWGINPSDVIAWLERQGEQKPVDKCAGCNNVKGCITCTDGDQYAHIKEYNPVWSEEDEHCIELLLPIIDSSSLIPKNRKKCKNFLKSLKDRYTWKPSEEQMKALNYVINIMASSESPTKNDYYYNVFKDMRTHLKKLREE